MPYTEVKVRVQCKCAEVGDPPDPTCTLCKGVGWTERWQSIRMLLINEDVQFEPGMD